jgi:hypothetical protein
MNDGLFIKLYLDEDVSVLIAAMLRSRGFLVATTVESGKLGSTNLEQLEFAARNGCTLVTHNRVDFERLAIEFFESGMDHEGIIISGQRIASDVTMRLLRILNERSAAEMTNQIVYI